MADLMDFSEMYWQGDWESVSQQGLNEEGELCDLLDSADQDADIALGSGGELDNSVEALLTT